MDGILIPAVLPADTEKPEAPRGFSNPDILAKAQAARKRNAESDTPQDLHDAADIPPVNKRGRKPGSASKRSERSLEQIRNLLIQTHFMIAGLTGFQEMMIDEKESALLADALAGVSDYYKIKLDGKSGAVMGLIYAIGIVYGPRAITIGIKLRNQKKSNGNQAS